MGCAMAMPATSPGNRNPQNALPDQLDVCGREKEGHSEGRFPCENITREMEVLDESWMRTPSNSRTMLKVKESGMLRARCVEYIQQLTFFRNLSREACEAIALCLNIVVVRPGQTLFYQGDPGNSLYFIVRGALGVEYNGKRVDTRLSGDCVGEVSLTISNVRGATILCEGATSSETSLFGDECQSNSLDVELLQLVKQDFDDIIISFPDVRTRIEAIGQIREQNKAAAVHGACISRIAARQEETAQLEDEDTLAEKLKKLSRAAGTMPRTGSYHDLTLGARQMDGKTQYLKKRAADFHDTDSSDEDGNDDKDQGEVGNIGGIRANKAPKHELLSSHTCVDGTESPQYRHDSTDRGEEGKSSRAPPSSCDCSHPQSGTNDVFDLCARGQLGSLGLALP